MSPVPDKSVRWLLEDLCSKLGYSMAVRTPEQFISLVPQGPDTFSDAVLIAEGLDPSQDKRERHNVHEFVCARFKKWAEAGFLDPLDDDSPAAN